MRPPNPNPLAPRMKVNKLKIDPDIAIWLFTAGITIILCFELALFMYAVFAGKEHETLDTTIAWTGLSWFTAIAIACIRIFGASKTVYLGP